MKVKQDQESEVVIETNPAAIPVEEKVNKLSLDNTAVSSKERLSAYFTIAAAAFGLISDGCE